MDKKDAAESYFKNIAWIWAGVVIEGCASYLDTARVSLAIARLPLNIARLLTKPARVCAIMARLFVEPARLLVLSSRLELEDWQ